MSDARYIVVDRFATTASALRPKPTWTTPRYQILDTQTREVVDEFITKRIAQLTARDLNGDLK